MNSNRPMVSAVLPVRNGAETLDRVIRSVVAQTLPDWEFIIIDDGSTDYTTRLVCDWSQADRLSRTDSRYHPEAILSHQGTFYSQPSPLRPEIRIVGSGRPTRKRVAWLEPEDAQLAGCIDLNPNKIGQRVYGKSVLSAEGLAPSEVSYVGFRGARKTVQEDLHRWGV